MWKRGGGGVPRGAEGPRVGEERVEGCARGRACVLRSRVGQMIDVLEAHRAAGKGEGRGAGQKEEWLW